MATFGEICSNVSKRLLDPNNVSISSSDVAAAVNDAIRYWKYRRFWFNTVSDTATILEGDSNLPFTGDAVLVPTMQDDGFSILYSGMRYILAKVTQAVYDNLWLQNGLGIPQYYARVGQQYQVYPVPDRDYTVIRNYLKDYNALSAPSDTNDFTDNAARLIMLWACGNLTMELRQDDRMADYYQNAANDEWRQLRVMGAKADGTGKLELHTTLYI